MDLAARRPVIGCAGGIAEAGLAGEYVTVGTGWTPDASGVAALKFFYELLPAFPDRTLVESEVERAFREWARYANVSFALGTGPSDARTIALKFARAAHGDGYPFDGPGGVLAHTFYPSPPNNEPLAGDMHFDADESWRIGGYTDVYSVALHEAGHALGLGHSDHPGSVMYPYYQFLTGLTADDIAGVRALYGAAGDPPESPPTGGPQQPPGPPGGTPSQPPTPPRGSDTTPPTLRIISPASTIGSTTAASMTVSGTASDNVALATVKWSTSTGYSGTASGTASWNAQVPLLVGTTVLTVRAYDATGNSAWRAITLVRR